MAFENEYISEEDIKKYKLDEVWLKWHPFDESVPKYVRLTWTVDREREAYFMRVRVGREEESNQVTFVFYTRGEKFTVKLDRAPGGSINYKERPYRIVWRLVGIWPAQPKSASRDEVLNDLKDALTAFGEGGVRSYVTDTVVEFMNFGSSTFRVEFAR